MAHLFDYVPCGMRHTSGGRFHSTLAVAAFAPLLGHERAFRSVLVGLSLLAALAACNRAEPEASGSTPKAEPEVFSFKLPSEYSRLELHGEGSETLRVPPGAKLTQMDAGYRIDAGPDFALEVRPQAPTLAELESRYSPRQSVFKEPDVVIFKAGAGYEFVAVVELVPEWDETDRRRFSCTSAAGAGSDPLGAVSPRADSAAHSRAAVQNMVSACRSLELPRLE
jgi:hypothetical protein